MWEHRSWRQWGKNLLGSRFLGIVSFIDKTCLRVRRAGFSQPSLCLSFPELELRKKTLVECFAKHLALLDSMQKTVKFVDLKNLGIDSSCAWLCPTMLEGQPAPWPYGQCFQLPPSFCSNQKSTDTTLGGTVLHCVCICQWSIEKACSVQKVCL